MTPDQVRQAEKLLVRLALIKTLRGYLSGGWAIAFKLTATRTFINLTETVALELDGPSADALLDQQCRDLRRALEALGVTKLDGSA